MNNINPNFQKHESSVFQSNQNLTLPKSLPNIPKLPESLPLFNNSSKDFEEPNIPFFEVKDNIVETELPILENFEKYDTEKKPIFIRTDEYSKVLDCVDTMKDYVKDSPDVVMMLRNLKKNKDLEFRKYLKNLEDMQRKLVYIDNLLFEAMKE